MVDLDIDEKFRDTYRYIRFCPETISIEGKLTNSHGKHHFKPSVSFDTVPITLGFSLSDDEDEYDDYSDDYVDDDSDDDSDDGSNDVSSNSLGSNNSKYSSPTSRSSRLRVVPSENDYSRGRSPPPTRLKLNQISSKLPSSMPASAKNVLSQMFKVNEDGKLVRIDYPSRPSVVNNALMINRSKANWKTKWNELNEERDNAMQNKKKTFQYPEILFPTKKFKTKLVDDNGEPLTKEQRRKHKIIQLQSGQHHSPRTILCHISGRKHTWVALDWALGVLSQDTDHIVVVANLPILPKYNSSRADGTNGYNRSRSRSRSRSRMRQSLDQASVRGRSTSRGPPGYSSGETWLAGYNRYLLDKKLKDIFEYIMVLLPSEKAVKITIEFVLGSTIKTLSDAVNVYTPDFILSSTLKWKRTDALVAYKGSYLNDLLSTSFPIPLFIVPAKNMYGMEIEMQESTNRHHELENGLRNNAIESNQAKITGDQQNGNNDVLDSKDRDDSDEYSSAEDDDSDSDVKSVKSSMSSTKSKLQSFAAIHRKAMNTNLKEVEKSNQYSSSQKLVGKLDMIINTSLKFITDLSNISADEIDRDSAEFKRLKNILVGAAPRPTASSKRSMLDVSIKSGSDSKKFESGRNKSSAIKFASTVKGTDGYDALGNSVKDRARSRSRSKSKSPERTDGNTRRKSLESDYRKSQIHTTTRRSVSDALNKTNRLSLPSSTSNTLRKIKSASIADNQIANDTKVKDKEKKKKGFLSFFKK